MQKLHKLEKELEEAQQLIKDAYIALRREGWEPGYTLNEITEKIANYCDNNGLYIPKQED